MVRPEAFRKVHEEFQQVEKDLLGVKRNEYAEAEGDVLQNFHVIAQLTGLTPAQIAANYLAKHVQSILKQVYREDFTWTWTTSDGEGLKQRVADARNYLLLLAACIEEEVADQSEDKAREMEKSIGEYLDHDAAAEMFASLSDLDRAKVVGANIYPGESSREAVLRAMKEKS